MANHRADTRTHPRDTANPTLAAAAITFGIFGVAGAWWPWFNQYTALAAMLGAVAGLAGIWTSRQVAAGVGVVLCGAAVILTLAVQHHTGHDTNPLTQRVELTSGGC